MAECFLACFSDKPCEGEPREVHLLPKQKLKRLGHDPKDPRASVQACGGPWPGLSGHHGAFDAFKLTVPREAVPQGCEELAEELNLGWYLDQRFGQRDGS